MPDTPSFDDLPGLEPDEIQDSDSEPTEAEPTQPSDPASESGTLGGNPPSDFSDDLPDFNPDALKPNEEELDNWYKEAFDNPDPTDPMYETGRHGHNARYWYGRSDISAGFGQPIIIMDWEDMSLEVKQLLFGAYLTEEHETHSANRARYQQKKLKARHKVWWRAIALGGLGVIAGAFVLAILFQEDPPDTQTLEPPTAATQEGGDSASQPAVGPEEPLSEAEVVEANEIVAEFIECPTGTTWDSTGKRRSAPPHDEVPEVPPETQIDEAFALDCSGHKHGSYVFTMIVRGDAETIFTQDGTTFDLRFIVNNAWPDNLFEDDTGFTVFIGYNKQFDQYVGSVTDASHSPVGEATVEIVWLEPTTLEVTVKLPGEDVDVRNVRTELLGLIQDEQEITTARYLDVAIWTAEP